MKFIKIKNSEQPTTPKPTTTLPDNMMYAWDPKANQWIAVMKDNPVVTPPTYNPNNVNNLNNTTTTQMYTPIKSANKEKTMQEYENEGCDTTNLMKACQHIYYGFYDEIKNKWSPEKLLNYMEKRLDNAKNNPDEAKFEKNWATSRFPEAIELVKQFIENCNGKKEVKSSADSYNIIMKAKKMSDEFYGNDDSKIDYMLILKLNEDETDIIDAKVIKKKEAPTYPINPHEYFLYMDRDTGWNEIDYSMHPTSELKRYYGNEEQVKEWYKDFTKQSSLIDSLNQFLDGDKYSKEIKIEKGLISGGLIKLAGINPIRGPKYSITNKGLNLLKQAAQEEYDFEKDYINARKSYLLDGITESEFKTGSPQSQGQMPKFIIFEKDGSELAQIEAKNSTDAKVKFFMENPEYEGSQSIEVKEIDSAYGETTTQGLDFPNQSVSPSTDIKVDTKGWVNVQSAKLTPQLLSLGGILDPYIKNGSVGVSIEDENKGNISVRGDAKTINTIESKVRDLGIFCNNETLPADEGKGIYTLNIFLED